MGIRSELALAVSKQYIDSLALESIKTFLESADDVQDKNNETVGDYKLYIWDWVKWYEENDEIQELYEWLNNLPKRYDENDENLIDNCSYQLIVFTPEIGEIIYKGSYSYGLSVGIQSTL